MLPVRVASFPRMVGTFSVTPGESLGTIVCLWEFPLSELGAQAEVSACIVYCCYVQAASLKLWPLCGALGVEEGPGLGVVPGQGFGMFFLVLLPRSGSACLPWLFWGPGR